MAASKEDQSNSQLLQELEALSQSLYQSHLTTTNRRTASLVLPRNSAPPVTSAEPEINHPPHQKNESKSKSAANKSRPRRMSLSPWRSPRRPKHDDDDDHPKDIKLFDDDDSGAGAAAASTGKKLGIWNWKPIRALSHIGMHKLSCLFSVEVVAVQGLPTSMNGLRLSVCVRKQETKDAAVHTMPSRVSQGAADFEETLFIKCHIYGTSTTTPAASGNQQLKFEPRPFLIYVFAVDTDEIDFGRSSVDLSRLIQESMAKSNQGTRVRQWDTSFNLAGKAKGGQLVLKLGFQIMEKDGGGIGIYNQVVGGSRDARASSSSAAPRKQSKTSFSIPSPKLTSRTEIWTPSQRGTKADTQVIIDHLNLDEPPPPAAAGAGISPPAVEEWNESKFEDLELPEFEVVDKGIEIQQNIIVQEVVEEKELTVKSEQVLRSQSTEDVKEMVHDQFHLARLTELDSIAQQIKALESLMGAEESTSKTDETESQGLDDEEDAVTREFLQRLEDEEEEEEETTEYQGNRPSLEPEKEGSKESSDDNKSSTVLLPDLGKGLGSIVQTRNGGYLAAMNPLDVPMRRKDTPKLAMQMSKPFVLASDVKSMGGGFELFQRMASIGLEELSSEIVSLMPVEEIMGKTAEQVAFEGIASAIINARNKEGASFSAARTIAAVKTMATAMTTGRRERITTGIWNVSEDPLTVEEILAFSMQKIEVMSIDALKIQAEMSEEDAPFDVSPLAGLGRISGKDQNHPLASAVPLDDWMKNNNADADAITMALIVQLRDPLRRYEAVGGPVIVLIQATEAHNKVDKHSKKEKKRFKVMSLHIGGMRAQTGQKRNGWDTEKQRLTAMQWLVAYGFGKAAKKAKTPHKGQQQDFIWSLSSRIMADMWLKSIRNPDVKFTK
ncbi:hypothetical protein Dimus_023612 [Dionaea muscipula]